MPAAKCAECGEVHLAAANGAIYCCGPLLRAVQMSNMFRDCKTFVDMSCRYSPERILADWQLFCSCKKNETSLRHLTNFVESHFEQPGTELEYWSPPDWRSEPAFLAQIKDPQLRKFGSDLNKIWKQLGRHMKDSVRTNPLQYSLVYVPNPLIVPGGRFIEFYYWDTYWIIRGLLYSGMYQTARGMIDNFLYLVQEYKFVPNGGRIYYWGRSQPPLLIPMVKAYVDVTKDEKYALKALPILEMEMDSFLKYHAVQVQGRTMYQYRDKSAGPRPESYREDVASASSFTTDEEKEEHYSHLKAACESGMDFSSRWFVSASGNNMGTLANTKTTWIVPVDLNCILFRNCKTLAEFNTWAGRTARSEHYKNIACGLIKAITAVLWNKEMGVWLDYDLKNKQPRNYYCATNLSPLWARAYPINDAEQITESVMRYIQDNSLDSFPGGVPHTLSNTGLQWDYPNVWPPMMHMLIEGLNNLGTPAALEMSQRWRERWVRSNYQAYMKSGFMFEKYNCEEFGGAGGGGEYPNQTGFGWTNGVLLELLSRYGQELKVSDNANIDACSCERLDDQVPSMAMDNSALEECPITSEAYLEQRTKSQKPTASKSFSRVQSAQSTGETVACSEVCCRTVYNQVSSKIVSSFATSEAEPCTRETCGQLADKIQSNGAEDDDQQECGRSCDQQAEATSRSNHPNQNASQASSRQGRVQQAQSQRATPTDQQCYGREVQSEKSIDQKCPCQEDDSQQPSSGQQAQSQKDILAEEQYYGKKAQSQRATPTDQQSYGQQAQSQKGIDQKCPCQEDDSQQPSSGQQAQSQKAILAEQQYCAKKAQSQRATPTDQQSYGQQAQSQKGIDQECPCQEDDSQQPSSGQQAQSQKDILAEQQYYGKKAQSQRATPTDQQCYGQQAQAQKATVKQGSGRAEHVCKRQDCGQRDCGQQGQGQGRPQTTNSRQQPGVQPGCGQQAKINAQPTYSRQQSHEKQAYDQPICNQPGCVQQEYDQAGCGHSEYGQQGQGRPQSNYSRQQPAARQQAYDQPICNQPSCVQEYEQQNSAQAGCGHDGCQHGNNQQPTCVSQSNLPHHHSPSQQSSAPQCAECGKQKQPPLYSLASDANNTCACSHGIEIEMNNVNCMLDLSPSQEEELLAMCPCESSRETIKCTEDESCAQLTDNNASCDAVPNMNPIMMNKMFPLADANSAGKCQVKAKPETEKTCCSCDGKPDKSNLTKECD